ncbi:serine hydrolase [Kribbella sp. VKM Ac-2566]|uniref:serine hydrolase domain-containing protein n=1 Tax=Kribbella sp. VKM Ac-2566 TaxID=2512218 RepID=UPI001062F9C5|nr:serine hydrolase domain-containing protein [Kribbella sp. VKM Ac-2566]TDX08263.1 CubicO group peptidase (beta-lactamase class C family) [Kribbella sp. VKM Ac-2566]
MGKLTDSVDDVLNTAVTDGVVPGAVAVITGSEGLRCESVAGRVRIDKDAPVRADTIFRTASMTKALTSVGALQLIERGRLSLTDEVASIVPGYGELAVLEGYDGDRPRLRPAARQATILDLLRHTSGHGYWFSNVDLLRYLEMTGTPDPFTGRRGMFSAPLVADPGTRWEYGISTDWLGQVIEAITDQPLDSYLAEHVFGPLGMTDTTFFPNTDQRSRLMPIHDRTAAGGLSVSEIDLPVEPEFAAGGHGAYSTARDYARFMTALLRDGELDGERLLRAETVELAFTDHLDGMALPDKTSTAVPALTNDMGILPFRQGFGLAFQVVHEDIPGMRQAGTGFWAGLFNSYYWIDRRAGIAGALFTQVLPFFDAAVQRVLAEVELAAYAEDAPGRA